MMRGTVGRCCDYRAMRSLTAIPAAADPTGDPGNVGTLTPPASKASTATLDDQFLAQIARWGMRVADVHAAIAGAHDACAFLAVDGHTAEDVIEQGMRVNSSMTREDEIAFYNAAVSAYCPKYLRVSGSIA
jgi:predicted trehalose synthase